MFAAVTHWLVGKRHSIIVVVGESYAERPSLLPILLCGRVVCGLLRWACCVGR